ncbi:MAG: GNAT family N-acetyltransferase [Terracidiphilus sp.]|jgi:predicted GNAT family N-acyltransferase
MEPAHEGLYRVESLGKQHDRAGFCCGVESLDSYLKTQASQDMRRKANAVFALVAEQSPEQIAGYFTLCACGLAPGEVPEEARKHIPRYPQVSATLLGRLAVRMELHGQGLGGVLLAEALRKAYENAAVVGSSMVVVDAIDDRAARFYRAHGFIRLPESLRLILPMRMIGGVVAG